MLTTANVKTANSKQRKVKNNILNIKKNYVPTVCLLHKNLWRIISLSIIMSRASNFSLQCFKSYFHRLSIYFVACNISTVLEKGTKTRK